jgi:hypothetical protein
VDFLAIEAHAGVAELHVISVLAVTAGLKGGATDACQTVNVRLLSRRADLEVRRRFL